MRRLPGPGPRRSAGWPAEGPWAPAGATSYTGISPHTTISVWIDTRG
ncbi:hypothetical protein AB0L53_05855 [Nonomuraea sp. NPDC052129]